MNPEDLALDFEYLAQGVTIELDHTQMEHARTLSAQVLPDEYQQYSQLLPINLRWRFYRYILGLFGLTKWLAHRVPGFKLDDQECSLWNFNYLFLLPAISGIKISQEKRIWKLGLIMVNDTDDKPLSWFEKNFHTIAEFTNHFYIVIRVVEELGIVQLLGFISFSQLNMIARLGKRSSISSLQLNPNFKQLLLYLRFLPEPSISGTELNRLSQSNHMIGESELQQILTKWEPEKQEIWEVLTMEIVSQLARNQGLLKWFVTKAIELLTCPKKSLNVVEETSLLPGVINVAMWLNDEIDSLAKQVSLVLLPILAPVQLGEKNLALGMRSSSSEELDAIVTSLAKNKITIPAHARASYRDFQLAKTSLRLYIITWPLAVKSSLQEWTLLLILGTLSLDKYLPQGLQIKITSNQEFYHVVSQERADLASYLYALIEGSVDEYFTVGINLPTGESFSLPPLAFQS